MRNIFEPIRSYDEVAKIMTANGDPITAPGVRVIERRALEKLRKAFEKKGITKLSDLYGDENGRVVGEKMGSIIYTGD